MKPCSSYSALLLTEALWVCSKAVHYVGSGKVSLEICVCARLCAHSVCGIRITYPMHVSHVLFLLFSFQIISLYHLPNMSFGSL